MKWIPLKFIAVLFAFALFAIYLNRDRIFIAAPVDSVLSEKTSKVTLYPKGEIKSH